MQTNFSVRLIGDAKLETIQQYPSVKSRPRHPKYKGEVILSFHLALQMLQQGAKRPLHCNIGKKEI